MKNNLIIVVVLIILAVPAFVSAQGYEPLVGIPGLTDPNTDFNTYVNILYALSISIAALLAVIKIVIGGVKWMMSDIVTSKSEAKSDIRGALLGLLVVLAAVLIITVINPDILDANLSFNQITPSALPNAPPSGPSALTDKQPGDQLFPLGQLGLVTSAERRALCEGVVPSKCPDDSWFQNPFALKSLAACFPGTYYENENMCLVRAADLRLPSFKCAVVQNSVTGESDTDCNAAADACRRAMGVVGPISPGAGAVPCTYPSPDP